LRTVGLLRNLVGTCKWQTAGELIRHVTYVGRCLVEATDEVTVGNAVRRVLCMIREDYASLARSSHRDRSLHDAFINASSTKEDDLLDEFLPDLKPSLMEQILEFYDEINNGEIPVAGSLLQPNDVVLTVRDPFVADEAAVCAALKKVRDVFVVVSEPLGECRQTDDLLSLPNATVIPETAVVAVMPRVDAVLLSARSVSGDGSFVAGPASFLAALAAKNFAKPVLAVAALYKLCPPDHPFLHNVVSNDPSSILNYADLPSAPDRDPDDRAIEVLNPNFDHVPAHLVDLYVTNSGAHQPSYVGRLLAELYSPHDASLLPHDSEDDDDREPSFVPR